MIATAPHRTGPCQHRPSIPYQNSTAVRPARTTRSTLNPSRYAHKETYGCARKVVATAVEVVSPFLNGQRRLLCDAWFGTVATARLLIQRGIQCQGEPPEHEGE